MIDLHIHSTNSDSTDNVVDILTKAAKLNLEIISITDHDTVKAYYELNELNIKEYYQGTIINGIELKCYYQGFIIDTLVYNFNIEKMNKKIKEIYTENSFYEIQIKKLNHLYDVCKSLNIAIDSKENLLKKLSKSWATVTMYNEIKKHPENKTKLPIDLWNGNVRLFSKKYISDPSSVFYYDFKEDYPSLQQIVDIAHECGGLIFLAHLFEYSNIKNKKEYLDNLIANYEIDGIEVYYPTFTKEQTLFLEQYTKENKLFMSGGSDCHGSNKIGHDLGIVKINKNITTSWIKEGK